MNELRTWLLEQFNEIVNPSWANFLMRFTMIILWILVGYLAMKILSIVFSSRLTRRFRGNDDKHAETITKMISNLTGFFLIIFLIFVILNELGVDLTTIIAGAGIVGLAVGFGAQELIKDLISGFFIIAERIFSVGEPIEYGGFVGRVQRIGLRTTRIQNWKSEVLVINNSDIRSVKNLARNNSTGVVLFKVAYGTNLSIFGDDFTDHLNAVSYKYDQMIGVPTLSGITDMTDGGITLRVTFTTVNFQHYAIERALKKDIYDYLIKRKVSLPGYSIKID